VFVAHRALRGELLDRAALTALTPAGRSAVAEQVAAFLEAMHGWTGDGLRSVPVQLLSELGETLLAKAEELLFPRMSAAQQARAAAVLHELATSTSATTVRCHGDVGGNVLFDEDTGRVGIIDFGMTTMSDPAVDAASLRAGLGQALLDAVLERYPALVERPRAVDQVQATFALQDALWSAQQEDWTAVDATLADLG
jgi:aminoglycoside 2''-phosphotransferase